MLKVGLAPAWQGSAEQGLEAECSVAKNVRLVIQQSQRFIVAINYETLPLI